MCQKNFRHSYIRVQLCTPVYACVRLRPPVFTSDCLQSISFKDYTSIPTPLSSKLWFGPHTMHQVRNILFFLVLLYFYYLFFVLFLFIESPPPFHIKCMKLIQTAILSLWQLPYFTKRKKKRIRINK